MKRLLFFLLLLVGSCNLWGQKLYVPGDTIRCDSASYICESHSVSVAMTYRNINFTDTTKIFNYNDGSKEPDRIEHIFIVERWSEIEEWIKTELFTPEEYDLIKGMRKSFNMIIYSDNEEKTVGVMLELFRDDPVFARIDANRLFELEKKLKVIMRLRTPPKEKKLKNFTYRIPIQYSVWK